MNNQGEVVFVGSLSGQGDAGVWKGDGSRLESVAIAGQKVAISSGEAVFSHFKAATLNSRGDVVFNSVLAQDPRGDRLEVAPGDSRTIRNVSMLVATSPPFQATTVPGSGSEDGMFRAINAQGQLAFAAVFEDGTSGVFVSQLPGEPPQLRAGDANQDLSFTQEDIVRVVSQAKYLSGERATWGEGDWNGAPGGSVGRPPPGDGAFDQHDIIAAVRSATYLTGPYSAIRVDHESAVGRVSIGYRAETGEMWLETGGDELSAINISSSTGVFTAQVAENFGGIFDIDSDSTIFKATFGGSFGSIHFGEIARPGLSRDFLINDITVAALTTDGDELGKTGLIYVPEPATLLLAIIVAMIALLSRRLQWMSTAC